MTMRLGIKLHFSPLATAAPKFEVCIERQDTQVVQGPSGSDLYLVAVAGGDVGDGPAGFFADGLFVAAQQMQETWQCRTAQNNLKKVTQ